MASAGANQRAHVLAIEKWAVGAGVPFWCFGIRRDIIDLVFTDKGGGICIYINTRNGSLSLCGSKTKQW